MIFILNLSEKKAEKIKEIMQINETKNDNFHLR